MEDSRGDECKTIVEAGTEDVYLEDKIGVIKKIDEEFVAVKVFPSRACIGCKGCSNDVVRVLKFPKSLFKEYEIEVGDVVYLSFDTLAALKLSLKVFVVPVITFLLLIFTLLPYLKHLFSSQIAEFTVIIIWGAMLWLYLKILNNRGRWDFFVVKEVLKSGQRVKNPHSNGVRD